MNHPTPSIRPRHWLQKALGGLTLGLGLLAPASAFAAFGLTTTTDFYTVDTGAGVVFSVRRTEPANNQQTQGDLSSIKFNGVEYQDQVRGSQVGLGIGGGTVTATTYGTSYIKIAVTCPDGGMTHYYMARNGYRDIYMATYFTSEPSIGNVRFITRIPYSLLPNGPRPSDLSGTTGAIESGDIFGLPNGETRSKHYSGIRQKDWLYTGATGNGVGIWMVKGNTEGMSGGPFYRSLINQGGGDQEIYAMLNYGEAQTEAYRTGILNTYSLVFTTGGTPATPDLSWQSGLGLLGYVADSGRGRVVGVGINGRDTAYTYTVGFANSTAQYWTTAAASNGAYGCYGMRPGTYTMNIYKNELSVWTGSVAVSANAGTSLNTITITADPSMQTAIWRIGNWDGTPAEFRNGASVTTMHPSDSRLASWNPGTYTIGSSSPSAFPCYQWVAVNGSQVVRFNLTSAQAAVAHTIRVGITVAYAGARPDLTVNSWNSANAGASTQPGSRNLTVGTYRGNNTTYSFSVPATAFVTGTNTLTISPISGSSGTTYLSPGYSFDCVDLY